MKYSIIIACYNLGSIVCKAIDSCIHQEGVNVNDYEVIVINDGSTDDTLEYIQKYSSVPGIRIIDKTNGGLSNTRNCGISAAVGDYILFLDGDDWLSEKALSTISCYLYKYDVISFPMTYYYGEDDMDSNLKLLKEGEYTRDEFLSETLGKTEFSIIPAPEKAYRRSFLNDNNIRFVEGILHEDNPFFIEMMNYCENVYHISTPLYYYLQKRCGSITYQHTLKNYQGVIAGIEHIERLPIGNNKYVRYLNANMLVYQITQDYKNYDEKKQVYSEMRACKRKKQFIKFLSPGLFNLKHTIRLLLLIIDPHLLKLVVR